MRGHVRKRGSGWAIVVELEIDPISGKRPQKWVSGFRAKAIAERELRRRLRLIDEGEDAFGDETRVDQARSDSSVGLWNPTAWPSAS